MDGKMKQKQRLNSLKLLAPIILVVIISGCSSPGGSSAPGNGIVIVNFEPDLSNVESGERMKLQASIKNTGVEAAENVNVEVAGIDSIEWQGDLFPRTFAKLAGFDVETNTEGQPATIIFSNLIAPSLSAGTKQTYRPQLRVVYDYKTTANLPITFVDREELKRLRREGKPLSTGTLTSSAGPLSVDIRTGNFIKTSSTFEGDNTFQVNIKVTNNGGGSVVQGTFTSGFDFDNPIRIALEPPVGTVITSYGGSSGCIQGDVVEGLRGQSWEISCAMEVTTPPTSKVDRTFKVQLDYTYLLTQETQVTVTGTGNPF